MEQTREIAKKSSFVLPVFIGMGVGAFVGLVAYVNHWL